MYRFIFFFPVFTHWIPPLLIGVLKVYSLARPPYICHNIQKTQNLVPFAFARLQQMSPHTHVMRTNLF